jgi:hypothetical protein
MNQPKAYGSFIKRGENTFRTSAYIQFGESEQSIGACLLLNPGSANFDKSSELYSSLQTLGYSDGKINTDPTMRQLIKLLERIYGTNNPLNGRFHIYNLFTLQNTASSHAIDQFEDLVNRGEYDLKESLVDLKELQSHPWILLGWSVERNSKWRNIELTKDLWRNLITESQVPTFGKKHKNRDDYYHPSPLISTHQPKILAELIMIYEQELSDSNLGIVLNSEKNKPSILRYTLLKWNKKYGIDAIFIVRDNWNNMQSLFTPGRCQDLFWFHTDLANDKSISEWNDFGNESFDDLEPIAF